MKGYHMENSKNMYKFSINIDNSVYLTDGKLSYSIKTSPYNKFTKESSKIFIKDILINPIDYVNIYEKYEDNIEDLQEIKVEDLCIYYTDGSKMPSSNTAGWAFTRLDCISKYGVYDELTDEHYLYTEAYGSTSGTTNNSGELQALYEALEDYTKSNVNKNLVIISDSEYSINIYREWIYNWEKRNYRDSRNKEIKNKDIILKTKKLIIDNNLNPMFCWVKGHEMHPFNEICDKNAKSGQYLQERKVISHDIE